jgi:hypothetical protein
MRTLFDENGPSNPTGAAAASANPKSRAYRCPKSTKGRNFSGMRRRSLLGIGVLA